MWSTYLPLWHTGKEMKHTMIDTSRPTCVYSPTSGAQVMTFPKSDLIPIEALCLCRTAIIINLKKNPNSLSNHLSAAEICIAEIFNAAEILAGKNLYCKNFFVCWMYCRFCIVVEICMQILYFLYVECMLKFFCSRNFFECIFGCWMYAKICIFLCVWLNF